MDFTSVNDDQTKCKYHPLEPTSEPNQESLELVSESETVFIKEWNEEKKLV